MTKIVYDGTDAVFGRLASRVAKDLLKGDSVDVINVDKIVISGDKKLLVKKILDKRKMGSGASMKGPKYPSSSDRLVKRMIRGMLPWDRAKGREAYKRLRCFVSEEEGRRKKEEGVEVVKLNYQKPRKFFRVEEVVRLLR